MRTQRTTAGPNLKKKIICQSIDKYLFPLTLNTVYNKDIAQCMLELREFITIRMKDLVEIVLEMGSFTNIDLFCNVWGLGQNAIMFHQCLGHCIHLINLWHG